MDMEFEDERIESDIENQVLNNMNKLSEFSNGK